MPYLPAFLPLTFRHSGGGGHLEPHPLAVPEYGTAWRVDGYRPNAASHEVEVSLGLLQVGAGRGD